MQDSDLQQRGREAEKEHSLASLSEGALHDVALLRVLAFRYCNGAIRAAGRNQGIQCLQAPVYGLKPAQHSQRDDHILRNTCNGEDREVA